MRVTNMELTNYQRALVIIHKLEDRFGSISKVPESNPKMQEIHRLLPMGRQSEDKNYARTEELNYLGYSNAHIAQVTHHGQATINYYFEKHSIKPKQIFYYKVVAPDHSTTYYADTLIHLYKIIFKKKIANNNYAKIHFLKQGYAVRTGKIIWMNVMDNSYYCVKNSSNLYIKNGLDSYMNSKA